ncbi:MAG: hypothetical protein NWF11_03715 [Candidatus Bathyarchaeota archaeon]|nr:hypothetical protein [Candidatus Bathyarchaeota archaeon]
MSVTYTPEAPTLDDDVTLIASCVDAVFGEPVAGLNVSFHAYQNAVYYTIGSSFTNSSGVATLLWHPKSFSQQYNLWPNFLLRVTCTEGQFTEAVEVEPVHIDTRYPTQLEFLGSEQMNAHVGFNYDLQWKLTSEVNGTPLVNEDIWIYYMNNSIAQWITTDSNGIATWWDWSPSHVGTFWFRAIFQGLYLEWYYSTSNEVMVVAVADVLPVSILFDVQPREFKPGDDITLTATVFNVSSGLPLTSGIQVSFYVVNAMGEAAYIGDGLTNGSGIATRTVPYHIGPNAYFAKVGVNQTIMSSTVMLTAATETELRLDAERDESSFNHTISGSLSSYGEPVDGKHLKIYVNGTLEADVTTWLYGSFNVTLNLQPENNEQTTYNVQAVFEGDDPCNATAYGFTPNGTRYAICSTIQYGYKPASNSTLLTVEPQTTQATQSTKTPEQLQQEAGQSGWLKPPKPEFSLFYPWFRLHYIMVYDGTDVLDVGLSPLGGDSITPYPPFDSWIIDAIGEVIISPVAKAYLIGWIGAEITLFLAMHGGPVGFAIGLGATILMKEALFQLASADTGGLKGSFVGALFSWAYGSITTMAQVAHLGITTLSEFFKISELDFWRLVYKSIYVFINMFYLIRIILKLVELGGW